MFVSRINELLEKKNRKARGLKRYTKQEMAEYVGVNPQTISNWASARGVITIDARQAAKLCDFLECGVWDLWLLVAETEEAEDDQGQPVGLFAA